MNNDQPTSEDFELPPGEAMLFCDCGYQSAPFCFDQHSYGCATCAEVVFPCPVPFVYEPPDCDRCGGKLSTTDRIVASRMKSTKMVRCPRCEANSLRIHKYQLQLLSTEVRDAVPSVGQTIHARTRQPQHEWEPFCFFSPRLHRNLSLGVVIANCERDSLPDAYHEFRTLEVKDERLVVEHIRRLPIEDWQWYFD